MTKDEVHACCGWMWGERKGERGGEDRETHHPMHGTYPAHFRLSPHGKSQSQARRQFRSKSPDPRCKLARAKTTAPNWLQTEIMPKPAQALYCLCMHVIGSRRALEALPTISMLLIGIQFHPAAATATTTGLTAEVAGLCDGSYPIWNKGPVSA